MDLRTVLIALTVIASAMTVLFIIHAETDNSSAETVYSGQCGPSVYYTFSTDGTLEISGTGAMYDYSGFTGHSPWYADINEIKKIVIGDDISYLGQWAFVKCRHATELTIPITLNSVSSDVSCAFAGCINLEKVNFTCGKDGNGYGYAAYKGFDSWYQNTPWYQSKDTLKEISFADGIRHIGSDAFRELNISSVVIPDTVGSLGCHCFFNCTKLTDLTIPVSLNSYGDAKYPAFHDCKVLENITITRGSEVPYDYCTFTSSLSDLAAWNINKDVAKKVTISEDVRKLGSCMFYGTTLKELTIPSDLVTQGITTILDLKHLMNPLRK